MNVKEIHKKYLLHFAEKHIVYLKIIMKYECRQQCGYIAACSYTLMAPHTSALNQSSKCLSTHNLTDGV